MRTRFLFIIIASIALAPALLAQTAALTYTAALTGANVVSFPGSTNGFANATLTINGNQATLDVATLNLPNVTGASLFQGAAGTNGPLVVTFTDPNNFFINGRFHGTVILDPTVIAALTATPQNFYLVVSTSEFVANIVRGQFVDANTLHFAGTISGTSPICAGGTGTPGAVGTFVFDLSPDPGGATFTLRYDILTTGLGNTITNLQIGDALTGPGLINFGINIPAVNGRFTGTGTITAPRARLLQMLPAGTRFTVTTPATGANCAAAGPIQTGHEIFIPVAGSVHGIGNTNFQTDLNIFNNAPQGLAGTATDVILQFFPAGASAALAQAAVTATIAPRGMAVYRDVSTTAFAGQISGTGAIRIVTAGNILANARIYNNLITSGGTFGQHAGGLPRVQALSEGTLVGLTNVSAGGIATTARTNIGFFNPSDTPATATFEMRDATGVVLATRTMTINPWQQLQMPLTGGLFTTITADVPSASVYFLSGTPIYVYASIVDNQTTDASYVTPSISSNGGTGAGF